MRLRIDELVRQSEADGFQLNESNCKELRTSFSRSKSSVERAQYMYYKKVLQFLSLLQR